MLKKYFSKYKWTDLFWILFVVLTCIYVGNRDLLPLNHQEFSLRGSFWYLYLHYFTYYSLINFSFLIVSKTILGKNSISGENKVNLPTIKRIVSRFFKT